MLCIPRVIRFYDDLVTHVELAGAFNIYSILCKGHRGFHLAKDRRVVREPITCLWCAARSR